MNQEYLLLSNTMRWIIIIYYAHIAKEETEVHKSGKLSRCVQW